MKKMMMVMCLLGLTAMIYARSPGDRMVISENSRILNEAAQRKKDPVAKAAKKAAAAEISKQAAEREAVKKERGKEVGDQYKYLAQNLSGFKKELNAVVAAFEAAASGETSVENWAYSISQIKDNTLYNIIEGITFHAKPSSRESSARLFTLEKAVQEANKQAESAETRLKFLAQNLSGFKKELNAVAKKHGDVVIALQKQEGNDSFFYQNAEIVLEDFAATVSQIKDDNLQKIVKGIINHEYSFPRKSVTKLFTLKEAAATVNDGALEAGNGIPSAGLQDNGFYKSLN